MSSQADPVFTAEVLVKIYKKTISIEQAVCETGASKRRLAYLSDLLVSRVPRGTSLEGSYKLERESYKLCQANNKAAWSITPCYTPSEKKCAIWKNLAGILSFNECELEFGVSKGSLRRFVADAKKAIEDEYPDTFCGIIDMHVSKIASTFMQDVDLKEKIFDVIKFKLEADKRHCKSYFTDP